ncbi:MAG: ribosome biogenesis GTP-binding protein YihA/YsxC [bacterium]
MPKSRWLIKTIQKMPPKYKGTPRAAIAVAGRSNVGKSTLINALLGQKIVATSKAPGRTRGVHRLLINDRWDLVDLPGYGFAKVGEDLRVRWREMVTDFLSDHGNLRCVLVLVDVRRGLGELDSEMIQWCVDEGVRAAVILTKSDKLGRGQLAQTVRTIRDKVGIDVQVFSTSAAKREGLEPLQDAILEWVVEKG